MGSVGVAPHILGFCKWFVVGDLKYPFFARDVVVCSVGITEYSGSKLYIRNNSEIKHFKFVDIFYKVGSNDSNGVQPCCSNCILN